MDFWGHRPWVGGIGANFHSRAEENGGQGVGGGFKLALGSGAGCA